MHSMGMYSKIAFEVVMAHFGANLVGKKSDAEYIKEPFLQQHREQNKVLTEEEKQREVDLFFAREKARKINWKRTHKGRNSTGS